MTRVLPRAVLALTAVLIPVAAAAQSQLDRMETLSERMTQMTYDAMASQIPALQGNLPSADWDDAMREAGECILDGVEGEIGANGVVEMLDNIETAVADATPQSILAGDFQPQSPAGISESQLQAINNECGMVELMMARLAQSGAMAIMMEGSQ